jgi:hypothetical protein
MRDASILFLDLDQRHASDAQDQMDRKARQTYPQQQNRQDAINTQKQKRSSSRVRSGFRYGSDRIGRPSARRNRAGHLHASAGRSPAVHDIAPLRRLS